MMKSKSRCFSSLVISLLVLLTNCSRITEVAEETPTASAVTDQPEASAITEGMIEPENIRDLTVIDRWGQGTVYGVALSPDETILAVSTATGIYLYDSATLEQKQMIDLPIIVQSSDRHRPNQAISFSPDGTRIAIGYEGILIWNLETNKIEEHITNKIADYGIYDIVQIAYAPHGRTIAVMSMGYYAPCDSQGGNYAIYEIESGNLIYEDYFCPESSMYHFDILEDGVIAFVGRPNFDIHNRVTFVNSLSGEVIRTLDLEASIFSVSPDGEKIVLGHSNHTAIIDTNSLEVVSEEEGIVIFLPDGKHQIVQRDGAWIVVNASNHEIVCTFTPKPLVLLDVYRSAFTLQADKLVFWNYWEQNVEIWDTTTCEQSEQLFIPAGYGSLKYSADGAYLATNNSAYIHIYNGESGEYEFPIEGYYGISPSQFYDFNSSENGLFVAHNINLGDDEPTDVDYWNLVSHEKTGTLTTNYESIYLVYVTLSGEYMAIIHGHEINMWETASEKLLYSVECTGDKIFFSPNNDVFAIEANNGIIFRDIRTGVAINSIPVLTLNFWTVFSPDWSSFAIITSEKIELWDISGKKLHEFSNYRSLVLEPASWTNNDYYDPWIIDMNFSPDGTILAAAYYDPNIDQYMIRFWDTHTGLILRDDFVQSRISQIEFSPDGKNLAILSNGIIYILGIMMSE